MYRGRCRLFSDIGLLIWKHVVKLMAKFKKLVFAITKIGVRFAPGWATENLLKPRQDLVREQLH